MHVRIPFWPYIKLMVICWLVIPHFDGSHYVYQRLVHPCLSMDTQTVMNRHLNESKKLFHSRETFLVVADRYIKENGAEALAKLIASKLKSTKPNVEVKEIKEHAAPEKNGEQVKQTEINHGETKSNTTCIAEIKERATALMTAEIEACRDDRTPEISLHKKVQKEWACAVCLVTTQSEATLNSHLQGKRHQATSEQLKAKNEATKDNGSPSASMTKKSDQSTKEEQPKCTSNNLNSKNKGFSAASTVKKPDETKDDERQKCASSNGPNQKNNKEWACAVCHVTTQSEATLNSHLEGKRHLATSEQLKAKNQATKINGSPSASMVKKSDQSTKEEQPKCTSNNLNSKNNGISAASTVKKPDETKDDERQKCASSNGLNQKNKKVWACAVCQVTTQSEATLNSHLQGKKHQATFEQLKAKNQATKTNGSPSASMAKKSDQSTKEERPKCTSNNLNSKNNGISAASTVKKRDETKDDERQKCASSNGLNQKNKKVWACAVCQITTQSEATLNSHLQGKRHQATSEQLKAKNQATKASGSPSASMAKKSDQSAKEEQLKCTSNNLNSKNNGISAASTVKKRDETKYDERQKCASSNGPNQKNKKVWACAVCQVTTQSEATLNSHLQGKRHQATSEQLKAKNQATKTSGSPSASMAKKSDQSTKEEQLKCTSNNLNSKNNGISAASTVKKPDETKDERQKCASSNGPIQKNNKKQEKALVPETNVQDHQKNLKQTGDGMKELGSWCNICNVSCTSELDMASHLNGRRHFDRIKQLSELWCSDCNVRCNSEADMASHQNGRRHLEQLKERSGLWCSICSVSCNSEVDMDSHLNGRRHLDQIKEQLKLWCGACNLMCNSELKMASHLNQRRHLKKMRNI
ncbi:hypothetical protein PVL29_003595 [Vitis rotundifolia]|uniref:Uncharacterized protein n=1 Tax=Vitis rotundifolia TaxID=103349 RepID=A0AA39AE88_VITRO|nr:hypothetical protein PVL29_003595 [Vitis rotundifolia]